jgi:hypothetical protein
MYIFQDCDTFFPPVSRTRTFCKGYLHSWDIQHSLGLGPALDRQRWGVVDGEQPTGVVQYGKGTVEAWVNA